MRRTKSTIIFIFTFILLFFFIQVQVFSSTKTSDPEVEKILASNDYKLLSVFLAKKLKKPNHLIEKDLCLYYYNTLSYSMLKLNDFDSAKNTALQAILLASRSKDSTLISNAWRVMANAYNRSGQLDSALHYSKKLLNYARRAGDQKQYRNAMISMGTIMMQNKRPAEALKFFMEVKQITDKLNDHYSIGASYYNIGLAQLELKKYDSCLINLQKSVEYAGRENLPDLQCMAYGSISDCYLIIGNKKAREKYLLIASSIARKRGNNQFLAATYSNLLQGALLDSDFQIACKYGATADSFLKIEPYPILQLRVDSMMYIANKKLSKTHEALAWLEKYEEIKAKIFGENQAAMLNRISAEYGIKEKNLIIAKQGVEIRSKKQQLVFVILLLLVTLVFITGLIRYIIKSRNFREQLFKKEKYLDQQIAELTDRIQSRTSNKETSAFLENTSNEINDNQQNLTENTSEFELYNRFLDDMKNEKLYLDPELSMKKVINSLGTNKTYLSQAINQQTNNNFKTVINRYRVDEAKKLIDANIRHQAQLDIDSIYINSGFNSTVSFYRAFKSYTGLTPKEYASELRKEIRRSEKHSLID